MIVDPLAAVPSFLTMTPGDTTEQRLRTARLACTVMAIVLLLFATAGNFVFQIFSITMPAFQIAASIVLLMVALDMLRARRSLVHETEAEKQAGVEKTDVAITPLAIPMLSGPGAISTTIVLQNQAHSLPEHIALYGCILAVALICYQVFKVAARGARWLSPMVMSIAIRIMGLLLAAIAVQFLINAVKSLRPGLITGLGS